MTSSELGDDRINLHVKISGRDIYRAVKQYIKESEETLKQQITDTLKSTAEEYVGRFFTQLKLHNELTELVRKEVEYRAKTLTRNFVENSALIDEIVQARVDKKMADLLARALNAEKGVK